MKKLLIQLICLVTIFVIVWEGIAQIPWMQIFKIEKIEEKWEDKVGELYWNFFKQNDKESADTLLLKKLDEMVMQICISNNIDYKQIKIHVLENGEMNAFALPGSHIVILYGLIQFCDNDEQLAGVICHELAHIQLNHISKKLIKEIGIAILTSTTSEKTIQIAKATQILSSTAFDRNMEKEADLKAIDYMATAQIDPINFADFMCKMNETKEGGLSPLFTWISTHPDPKARTRYILDYIDELQANN